MVIADDPNLERSGSHTDSSMSRLETFLPGAKRKPGGPYSTRPGRRARLVLSAALSLSRIKPQRPWALPFTISPIEGRLLNASVRQRFWL